VKLDSGVRRRILFYRFLLSLRPAQFSEFIKHLLRIERVVIDSKSRFRFWVDPASVLGFSLLWKCDFEPDLRRLIKSLIREGDVFIDVGAHEGYFSIIAGGAAGSCGHVVAIEPQTRLIPVLLQNAKLNAITNVEVLNVALSGKKGTARFYLRPSTNTGASAFYRHWLIGHKAVDVTTTTLDNVIAAVAAPIRLVKIDAEGAEGIIISGARESLDAGKIDFLTVDYHLAISPIAVCRATHNSILGCGYRALGQPTCILYFHPRCKTEVTSLKAICELPEWLKN
jgi:FkbM family methyltransferase